MTELIKISRENAAKAEKWSLPTMGSGQSQVFTKEIESAQPVEPAEPAEGTQQEQDSADIPTAEDIERWHQEAHAEGYQQGIKQAEEEIATEKKQLLQIINFFEQPLQYLNEEVEQQLTLMAVTLAQQLVRREIRVEPGEIIALIKESVKMLPVNSRKIRIFLHPEDAEIVRKTLQLDEFDEEQSWKLIEDPMITRGGCEIKSDQSSINVTLENRLQALAASVLGGERVEDLGEEQNDSSTN